MKKYLSFLFLVCIGCFHKKIVSIEPRYQSYVDNFVSDAQKTGRTIEINDLIIKSVPQISDEIIGQCQRGINVTPRIVINYGHWKNFSNVEREELLYHELGHCILNRWHKNDTDSLGIPISIMYPYILPEMVYLKYREFFIMELFRD